MRLEQLHYFEVLLQENSFHKAADKLHITQQSLSASIKAMENELGVILLLRNTRGFTLTDEGKKTLTFAKSVSDLHQNFLNSLTPKQEDPSGNIAILAPQFFCELVLEQLLQSFVIHYPKIKLRIIQNEFQYSPKYLSTTSCKFSIISRMTAEQMDGCADNMLVADEDFYDNMYQYLPLFSDVLGVCFSKFSDLAEQNILTPCALDRTEYPETIFPVGQIELSEKIMLSSNNAQLHINAMLNASAYCTLPYFVYQHYFAQEDSIIYRSFSNNMSITWYLIYPTDYTLTEAEQIFIDALQHHLIQMKLK